MEFEDGQRVRVIDESGTFEGTVEQRGGLDSYWVRLDFNGALCLIGPDGFFARLEARK